MMRPCEDEEAIQQVVFPSDVNLADNGSDSSNSTEEKKEEETSTTETPADNKKLTKQDVDNMGDDQVLAQALKKDQNEYETGAQQELINRSVKILQKNQTGALPDKDRQNIVNALINTKNG